MENLTNEQRKKFRFNKPNLTCLINPCDMTRFQIKRELQEIDDSIKQRQKLLEIFKPNAGPVSVPAHTLERMLKLESELNSREKSRQVAEIERIFEIL